MEDPLRGLTVSLHDSLTSALVADVIACPLQLKKVQADTFNSSGQKVDSKTFGANVLTNA